MRRKLLFLTTFLVVSFGLLYIGFAPRGHIDEVKVVPLPEQTGDIDFSKPTADPLHKERDVNSGIKQAAWVPDWAISANLNSIRQNAQYLDSISPVWYYLEKEGKTTVNKRGLTEIQQIANQHGIKVIPSIGSFSTDDLGELLNNQQKLDEHISFLISEVDNHNFSGLDIDHESIYASDKAEYLYMLRNISEQLHSRGKVLSIAVMPIWTEADIFRSLRQTRHAQDWYEIGPLVDEFRIMAYNLTDYLSEYSGPVSPLDWNEAILRYAIPRVDRSKIVLGLNLYGFDGWSNNLTQPIPYLGVTTNPSMEKGQADAVTYRQVREWDKYKTSEIIDQYSMEKLLTYRYEDKDYIVYYPDPDTVRFRTDLAKRYDIAGVAFWRMGGEHAGVYTQSL